MLLKFRPLRRQDGLEGAIVPEGDTARLFLRVLETLPTRFSCYYRKAAGSHRKHEGKRKSLLPPALQCPPRLTVGQLAKQKHNLQNPNTTITKKSMESCLELKG